MEANVTAPPRPGPEGAPAPVTPGEVRREPSEADVQLHVYGSKLGTVHVHGPLAQKHEVKSPKHHDPHSLNYAKAAKEEMHDVAEHPPSVKLVGKSGVEEWDHVNESLPSGHHGHAKHDAKELLKAFSSPRKEH